MSHTTTHTGEMTRPTPPTDPLVEALAIRLHRVDLVGWQREDPVGGTGSGER